MNLWICEQNHTSAFCCECLMDVIQTCTHGAFLVIFLTLLLVLYWSDRKRRRMDRRRWVHFPFHAARWLLLLSLFPCQLALIAEGTQIELLYSGESLHLYLPQITGAITMFISLMLYDRLEKNNNPRPLIVLLLYWLTAVCSGCFKTVALVCISDALSVRFVFSVLTTTIYAALLVVEVMLLFKLRYISSACRVIQPSDELQTLTYIHCHSSFLSQITWHWLSHFLVQGYGRALKLIHLGHLPKKEQSKEIYDVFSKIYEEEKMRAEIKGSQPSLWRCYWRHSGYIITVTAILKVVSDIMLYIGPMLLGYLVQFAEDNQNLFGANYSQQLNESGNQPMGIHEYFTNGYTLCLMITMATVLQAILCQNMHYLCYREAIRIKAAIQTLAYGKSLVLSESVLVDGQMSVGRIINHISTDVNNIFMLFCMGHFLWTLPIQILVGLVLLYHQLGLTALLSGVLIVLMVPVQYLLGKKISSIQNKVLMHSDKRLKHSRELLYNIKLVKLYLWEDLFTRDILKTRDKEIRALLMVAILRVISLCVCDCSPLIASLLTFTLHSYMSDEPLTGGKVFSSLAIFGVLSVSLFVITQVINIFCFGYVSTRRLEQYLGSLEKEQKTEKKCDADFPLLQYKMSLAGSLCITDESDNQTGDSYKDNNTRTVTANQQVENNEDSTVIKAENAFLSWQADSESFNGEDKVNNGEIFTLKNINLNIDRSELCVIVGSVGSGKSSLLSAFLGEMFLQKGSLWVKRDQGIAYVPQRPWLVNATIQDNILFGKKLEWSRYNRILEVCALSPDLDMFPAGDQTEVGEKGVNLSGGQKQRINVARAVYSQASLVIMDDPLSALDAPVAEHIFTNAIKGYLSTQGTTVVLVTHQLKYAAYADIVCCMDDGHVVFQGKPSALQETGINFLLDNMHRKPSMEKAKVDVYVTEDDFKAADDSMITTHLITNTSPSEKLLKADINSPTNLDSDDNHLKQLTKLAASQEYSHDLCPVSRLPCAASVQSINSELIQDQEITHLPGLSNTEQNTDKSEIGRLVTEEEHNIGAVPLSVYLSYIGAATWPLVILTLIGYLFRQFLRVLLDYWLAIWVSTAKDCDMTESCISDPANKDNEVLTLNITHSNHSLVYSSHYYMTRYLAIGVGTIVVAFVAYLLIEVMSLMAAKTIFKRMLLSIIHAPLRFFDITPVGRILNRMSGDIQIIDQKMVTSLDQVLYCSLSVLGAIVINAVATPYFLLLSLPMFVLYLMVQRFYIASSRELQRLDSITKSPVVTHFSETLSGLSSIRAYKAEERMLSKLWQVIDDNNIALLFFHTTNVWMGIRLDSIGAGIILAASICSLSVCLLGYITPEMVGLSVSYAVMVCNFMYWSVRGISEFEMWFNSVERVENYTNIPAERKNKQEDVVPVDWPTSGSIEFDDVSIRYDASLPPVIHHFSVNIKHGQKVGICGRTGSGKSTITLSLFSLVDVCAGRILIDGWDVSRVPLDRLRSSVAIIPQDPVLFSGTIRYNLDPTRAKTDAEIWQALEVAQLKDTLSDFPLLLDSQVSEGGENFSAGQRQLFSLARAILRHCQILIMDEATASIDFFTDNIIQDVIKKAFTDKTVITVAHRISTIMNCDLILVIEDGHLVENDTPANLLDTDSRFAAMLAQHEL